MAFVCFLHADQSVPMVFLAHGIWPPGCVKTPSIMIRSAASAPPGSVFHFRISRQFVCDSPCYGIPLLYLIETRSLPDQVSLFRSGFGLPSPSAFEALLLKFPPVPLSCSFEQCVRCLFLSSIDCRWFFNDRTLPFFAALPRGHDSQIAGPFFRTDFFLFLGAPRMEDMRGGGPQMDEVFFGFCFIWQKSMRAAPRCNTYQMEVTHFLSSMLSRGVTTSPLHFVPW